MNSLQINVNQHYNIGSNDINFIIEKLKYISEELDSENEKTTSLFLLRQINNFLDQNHKNKKLQQTSGRR